MPKLSKIIFDCERMKYAHTGLFHFCYHLGKNLIATRNNNEICFYTPASVQKIFGENECYLTQHSLQKFFLPSLKKFDVWHGTYQGTSYYPAKRKTKIVLTVHDLNFLYDDKKSVAKKKKYHRKHALKIERADAVVAISNFVKTDILNHFNIDERKVHVIYNGCNIIEGIVADGETFNFKKPFIFSIGTIARKKNFHVLPAALLNNDYDLVIAGIHQDTNYLKEILEKAENLGVKNRVHIIGPVTEPQKYWLLQHCSLFAFPSISEGFGLPVIEAMHFGKPVLLSTATSLPEIGGPHATFLSSFDADNVSLQAMSAIDTFSAEKSVNIKNWAAQFNWHKAAMQYWNVYERVLNE